MLSLRAPRRTGAAVSRLVRLIHRLRPVLLVVAVAVVAAGCRADAVVEIDVAADGSGVVRVGVSLDDEALAAVPDLSGQLQLDDLRAAGWEVTGPAVEADGLTWVRASKPFEEPARLGPVIAEVTGPEGILRGFKLERSRSFARTTFELTGLADPAVGLESLGDADLAGALGGEPLGRSLAELEAELGEPLADATSLTVLARFPDDVGATTGLARGREVRWEIRLDDPTATGISTRVSVADLAPRVWAAAAAGALVVLVATVLIGWLRRRRELRAPIPEPERPDPRSRDEIREMAKPAPKRRRVLEQVAIDANGVLFRVDDDDDGRWLLRFVRDRGVSADRDHVHELLRQASLGRLSSRELWGALGVDGDAEQLDRAYLEPFELMPGAVDFLERVAQRGLRVACVTNDVLAWSQQLRLRHDLDRYIETWIVSSDVGCRKPDPAIFEALRRTSGVPFANSLFIDDRAVNLDAARQLGMSTAWFTGSPSARPSGGDKHREVAAFDDLFPEQRTPA